MDEVEQRIEAFTARSTASVRAKLDALLDLEWLPDPRAVLFLLQVLADGREPTPVRIRALKRLAGERRLPSLRPAIGQAILRLLFDEASQGLRLPAALALAHFTDIDGVPTALGRLALDAEATIDLRYAAFVSLQAVGATPECIALLRQLGTDEAFGPSARNILAVWSTA